MDIRLPAVLLTLLLLAASTVACFAQDAPAAVTAPAPAAVEPAAAPAEPAPAETPAATVVELPVEIPPVTPDTSIFRRTPVVDGVVSDGEWDGYYSFTAGHWDAAAFADWDGTNLYFAVKSSVPVDVAFTLDADCNGWLHGEDNYEFRVTRGEGGAALAVSRYDSKSAASTQAVPVSPAEAAQITAKTGEAEGAYSVEIAVPASLIRSLKLGAGRKVGFAVAINNGNSQGKWVPATGPSSVQSCVLVDRKLAVLKPLDINFGFRDATVARGEELVGKFYLTNEGTETVDAYSFVIAGEGRADEYLSSQKVRLDKLPPKKHVSQEIRSIIPTDMPLGSWAVGAEVRSASGRLGGVLASFEVVEPFTIRLMLPQKPVAADVKDVTFGVVIDNNLGRGLSGTAKIRLPMGWQLWRDVDTRRFEARAESSYAVEFKAKPPLGVEGEMTVTVEVTALGETREAEGKFRIVTPQQ